MDADINTIRETLEAKPTEELRQLCQAEGQTTWSPEAMEAMRQILVSRGETGLKRQPLPLLSKLPLWAELAVLLGSIFVLWLTGNILILALIFMVMVFAKFKVIRLIEYSLWFALSFAIKAYVDVLWSLARPWVDILWSLAQQVRGVESWSKKAGARSNLSPNSARPNGGSDNR